MSHIIHFLAFSRLNSSQTQKRPTPSAPLGRSRWLPPLALGALLVAHSGQAQTISTIAGSGVGGFCGDGGPATSACLADPMGIAVDTHGAFFIVDQSAHVRRVDPSGLITTVAGNGTQGFCGDGGPALGACFMSPRGVAVDSNGILYMSDSFNHRIRKVDATGTITTVAGVGAHGFCGDGGPAVTACLDTPQGIAVDALGNLFIADSHNNRIRRVDTSGVITTVAGNGSGSFCGDDGPATSACLWFPIGVAAGANGVLFIADIFNDVVRKVGASGTITTVAGMPFRHDYCGDDGPATEACFRGPRGVAVDADGVLYVADEDSHRVRRVDLGGTITTVAGNGTAGFCGDGGLSSEGCLSHPVGLAIDNGGALLIGDVFNHRVRRISNERVLTLHKAAAPDTYFFAGQVIDYSYTVSNDGKLALGGPFSVTDDRTVVSCPSTPGLAPKDFDHVHGGVHDHRSGPGRRVSHQPGGRHEWLDYFNPSQAHCQSEQSCSGRYRKEDAALWMPSDERDDHPRSGRAGRRTTGTADQQ